MRLAVIGCLVLAACAGAAAQSESGPANAAALELTAIAPDPTVSRAAAEQPAGAYVLDPRHTRVTWRVRHWGLSLYTARFDQTSGNLTFDPQNLENSSVSVRIPVNSLSTGLLSREGERAFDRDIAAYLGGEAHPEIAFESRSIELTSATTGLIHGDLSFNGQSHPVTIETVFEGGRAIPTSQRHVIAFSGRTVIQRTRWAPGTVHNSASPGDDVEVLISVEFVKTQS
jgi:polyisoprenoid-binding protein YceI